MPQGQGHDHQHRYIPAIIERGYSNKPILEMALMPYRDQGRDQQTRTCQTDINKRELPPKRDAYGIKMLDYLIKNKQGKENIDA